MGGTPARAGIALVALGTAMINRLTGRGAGNAFRL
jgi:hypothetical protein